MRVVFHQDQVWTQSDSTTKTSQTNKGWFFVLSNSSKKLYFLQHVAVYQGKNAENIIILDIIKVFPTTQKVTEDYAFAIFI